MCSSDLTIRTAPELKAKADIPIIAMTGYALPGDREKFLEAGMDGYLAKPVEIEDILQAIRGFIQEGGEDIPPASGGPDR